MKHKRFLFALCILMITTLACNATTAPAPQAPVQSQPLYPTQTLSQPAAPSGGGVTQAPPPPPSNTNSIRILSVNPAVANGISSSDSVQVSIQYSVPSGANLQVWMDRFSDSTCRQTQADPATGASTMQFTTVAVNAGNAQTIVSLPPAQLSGNYAGIGARLWTSNNSSVLAEDMQYANCYPIRAAAAQPPAPAPVTNSIQVTSVDTSDEVPITKLAVITLQIRYSLASSTGKIETTLDMYSDSDCHLSFYDEILGSSHPVRIETPVSAGSGQITVSLPVANVISPYMSLFAGLWSGTELVARDDAMFNYCYAVLP